MNEFISDHVDPYP